MVANIISAWICVATYFLAACDTADGIIDDDDDDDNDDGDEDEDKQSTNKAESQIRFDSTQRRREARERTSGRDIVHSHGYHRTEGTTFHSDRRSRVLLCFAPPVPGEVGKRPRGIGASAFLKRFSRAVVSQEFLAMGNIGGLSHQDRGETLTDSRYQKHI